MLQLQFFSTQTILEYNQKISIERVRCLFRIGIYGIVMVELCRHHFRLLNLEGYHFALIYLRLATI